MNSREIGESVIVGAVFDPRRVVRPAWFVWNGRKIRITRVHYAWTERRGQSRLYRFSVTDGADTFQVVLNAETMAWHLLDVEVGG